MKEHRQESVAALERHAQNGASLKLHVDDGGECIVLPPDAVKHLLSILKAYAQGHDVAITRLYAEMTTMEVAHYLDMPAKFVVELLEKGELPYHRVGRHRRILRKDAEAYRQKEYEKTMEALDFITAESQAMGLYD